MFTRTFNSALLKCPLYLSSRNIKCTQRLSIQIFRYASNSSNPPESETLAKKKLTLFEQEQKQQKEREEKLKAEQEAKSHTNSEGNDSKENGFNLVQNKIIRKGFNDIRKVPETNYISPQDILLDKLFQGYGPLTVPIQPRKYKKKSRTVLYVELDQADDPFDSQSMEEEEGNGYRSPFAFSLKGESPRYEISQNSLNENDGMLDEFENNNIHHGSNNNLSLLNKYFKASKRSRGRKRFVFTKNKFGKDSGKR